MAEAQRRSDLIRVSAMGLVLSTGCSLAAARRPPPNHAKLADFQCTASNAMPVFDTFVAVFSALTGWVVIHMSSKAWERSALSEPTPGEPPVDQGPVSLVFLSATLLGFTGAVHGFAVVDQCKRARYELKLRAAQQAPARSEGDAPESEP